MLASAEISHADRAIAIIDTQCSDLYNRDSGICDEFSFCLSAVRLSTKEAKGIKPFEHRAHAFSLFPLNLIYLVIILTIVKREERKRLRDLTRQTCLFVECRYNVMRDAGQF